MKMKHFITASLIIMFASKVMAHSSHYEGLKKIEMDVLRNNEIIGSTNYFFEFDEDLFVDLQPRNVVNSRTSEGGTSFIQVEKEVNDWQKKLSF